MYFVVIVEPEEVNAARIRTILESVDKNFEYELTSSPEKAIEIVENKKVDVFISSLELTIMTGAELFSMIEMISPETVRVAMTSSERIVETVACMNQCRTFKVIIKPCRVADDLLSPINASIAYKEMCEKARREEEETGRGFFATERDLKKMEMSWHEKMLVYERIQNVLEKVIHTNINAGNLGNAIENELKSWYDWMLDSYIKTMIDSDGSFENALRELKTSYHEPKEEHYFQLKKSFEEAVNSQKMNEITFILKIVIEVYKRCEGKYNIGAIIENSDKAYILRIACRLLAEKKSHTEEEQKVREVLAKAAGEAMAAFRYKSVAMKKEKNILINIAVHK